MAFSISITNLLSIVHHDCVEFCLGCLILWNNLYYSWGIAFQLCICINNPYQNTISDLKYSGKCIHIRKIHHHFPLSTYARERDTDREKRERKILTDYERERGHRKTEKPRLRERGGEIRRELCTLSCGLAIAPLVAIISLVGVSTCSLSSNSTSACRGSGHFTTVPVDNEEIN